MILILIFFVGNIKICFYYRTYLSLNDTKNSTLYQSVIEGLIDSNNSVKSEELYTTADNSVRSSTSTDVELYHSAIQELYVYI